MEGDDSNSSSPTPLTVGDHVIDRDDWIVRIQREMLEVSLEKNNLVKSFNQAMTQPGSNLGDDVLFQGNFICISGHPNPTSAPYLHTSHRGSIRQKNYDHRLLREADVKAMMDPMELPRYYSKSRTSHHVGKSGSSLKSTGQFSAEHKGKDAACSVRKSSHVSESNSHQRRNSTQPSSRAEDFKNRCVTSKSHGIQCHFRGKKSKNAGKQSPDLKKARKDETMLDSHRSGEIIRGAGKSTSFQCLNSPDNSHPKEQREKSSQCSLKSVPSVIEATNEDVKRSSNCLSGEKIEKSVVPEQPVRTPSCLPTLHDSSTHKEDDRGKSLYTVISVSAPSYVPESSNDSSIPDDSQISSSYYVRACRNAPSNKNSSKSTYSFPKTAFTRPQSKNFCDAHRILKDVNGHRVDRIEERSRLECLPSKFTSKYSVQNFIKSSSFSSEGIGCHHGKEEELNPLISSSTKKSNFPDHENVGCEISVQPLRRRVLNSPVGFENASSLTCSNDSSKEINNAGGETFVKHANEQSNDAEQGTVSSAQTSCRKILSTTAGFENEKILACSIDSSKDSNIQLGVETFVKHGNEQLNNTEQGTVNSAHSSCRKVLNTPSSFEDAKPFAKSNDCSKDINVQVGGETHAEHIYEQSNGIEQGTDKYGVVLNNLQKELTDIRALLKAETMRSDSLHQNDDLPTTISIPTTALGSSFPSQFSQRKRNYMQRNSTSFNPDIDIPCHAESFSPTSSYGGDDDSLFCDVNKRSSSGRLLQPRPRRNNMVRIIATKPT